MAKERRNTVSLFDSMGKNKEAMTKTVDIAADNNGESTESQSRNKASNTDKTDISEKERSINKNENLTEKDIDKEEIIDDNSIITDDMEEIEEDESIHELEDEYTEELIADKETAGDEHYVKKRGRRRLNEEKDLQHIHIALPTDVYEKLEIGKKAYYNNKTTYIRNLILDDYERNKDYYERLPKIR